MRAAFFIAFRHLVTRRRQSLATLLGLAIGVMVLISSVSMMDGVKVSFIMQMLQVSPHITVNPKPDDPEDMTLYASSGVLDIHMPDAPDEEKEIRKYRAVLRSVERVPGVETAAPELTVEGFVIFGTMKKSAQIHGVDPERQKHIGNLESRVISGSYQDFAAATDGAILGYRLARDLTLGVGDRFQAVGKSGRLVSFKVSALMRTGVTSFDSTHVLVHLDRSRILEGTPPDRVTDINVRVTDPERVKQIAERIGKIPGVSAETWKQAHANVLSLYSMIGRISYFLVIFTMLAAGLGVSNLLTTVVLEKRKDIAVLLSMGYSRASVSLVFTIEGVALGTVGALLGCGLGYLNTLFLGSLPFDFGEASIISRDTLYMNQNVWYYILSAAFGFVVSLVAGVAPARRASRTDPVDIIRREV